MSLTLRLDGPLLPGFFHLGDRGQGVRGADIPAEGVNGSAIAFPSLLLPDDNLVEIMISILSVPPALTYFSVDELTRVDAEGPVGAHLGDWKLWANGEDRGTSIYTVLITEGGTGTLLGAAAMDAMAASGGFIGALPASELGGDAGMGSGQAGGMLIGGGPTLPPLLLTSQAPRLVRAGRAMPTRLRPFDADEVADVLFDFSPAIQGFDPVVAVAVTCDVRLGTDPAAAAMRVGGPVYDSTRAVQRLQAGIPGVVYLLHAVATLASGQRATASAHVRVRRP